jgi:small subunit ribosomal protein S4
VGFNMGKPKFSKKKYETPNHPWKEARIKSENELVAKYGLKNKREIWKAETILRKYRGQARGLLARIGSEDPQAKKEINQLISHLTRYNVLPLNSTLDDVLALNIETILSRRLQTLAYLKGFASTPKHSRQLINHGHIAIGDRCVNIPGYRVIKEEEQFINYTLDSPLNDKAHPARPSGDFISKMTGGTEQLETDISTPVIKQKDTPVIKKTKDKIKEDKQEDKILKTKEEKEEKPENKTLKTKEIISHEKEEKPKLDKDEPSLKPSIPKDSDIKEKMDNKTKGDISEDKKGNKKKNSKRSDV